jgi:hypothetical protein
MQELAPRVPFRESRAIVKCLAVVSAAACGNSATSLWRSPEHLAEERTSKFNFGRAELAQKPDFSEEVIQAALGC